MATIPITEAELMQFRKDTRGTAHTIHFNNAGTSLPPDVVVETVINYLQEEAVHGGYETEDKYREALENVYSLVARLINAGPDEVAITENASTAWWLAFHGLDLRKGDVIITSEMEYVTNMLGFIYVQKKYGVITEMIPNDAQGNFSLQALEAAITPATRLIAITHIASTAGGMMPIIEIGKIARRHNVLYLIDACQSAGHVPIDVQEINCDILSVTGRKYLRAPRGTGFLYVRKQVQDMLRPVFMDGHGAWITDANDIEPRNDARRFELYEKNRAVMLGLGKAVEYALRVGVDRIWQRIQQLAGLLRKQLEDIPSVTVHDAGDQQCGIVTFSVRGTDSALVKKQLVEKHINVSVGPAKATPVYMKKHHLDFVVRASVHYYNTAAEIKELCNAVMAVANREAIVTS